MKQELYLDLDTLEGFVSVREDRIRRYSFKIAPDRSEAQAKTEEFLTGSDQAISCLIEQKTQSELVNDMNRTETFNWAIRGFFGVPLRFKGNGE